MLIIDFHSRTYMGSLVNLAIYSYASLDELLIMYF